MNSTQLLVMAVALATCAATAMGGLFAIRLRDKLHLVLGFSAGAVIGVAFFDLLPEALALGTPAFGVRNLLAIAAMGFFLYAVLDRFMVLHGHEHMEAGNRIGSRRGALGAASLSAHSFLDGLAIGIAFQVSQGAGIVVAVAVLVHDFSDGLNTVNIVLKNNGDRAGALKWLALDAVAPVFGAGSSLFFSLPASGLAVILAAFSGFFFYIGATDLLPESQHAHPKLFTTFAMVLGAGTLYVVTRIAG